LDLRKKLVILIICLIILIVLLIAIMIGIKYNEKNRLRSILAEEQESYIDVMENPGKIIDGVVPKKLKNTNWFFTVKNCLNKYIEYINEDNSIAVYNLLDKEYIKNNNLTEKNVMDFVNKKNISSYYRILKVYQITGIKYGTYYVDAKSNNNEIFYIVNIDSNSNAFSIMPISKEEYQTSISTPAKHEQSQEDTVERNKYNYVMYNYDSEEEIVERYLQDYLETALFNTDEAYNLLDEEYSKLKFTNIDEFRRYIVQRKEMLEKMCKKTWKTSNDFSDSKEYDEYFKKIVLNRLDEYLINDNNGNKQYVCIDTFGNYYIFNIESIMNYTIMLDNYTIDLPDFVSRYKSANNQEKTALNIQKIVDALNDKDYKYVYEKLADSFKENYFKDLHSFEQYAKSEFGEKIEVEYNSFLETSNYCTYSITLKNINQEIEKTIIMDLQEGTNFVFSFNVD